MDMKPFHFILIPVEFDNKIVAYVSENTCQKIQTSHMSRNPNQSTYQHHHDCLDSLVVECSLRVREVAISIPARGRVIPKNTIFEGLMED